MTNKEKKRDLLLDTLNAAKRDNEPKIERYEFSDKEMQFFTALVGMCAVGGAAALLSNPYMLLGLFGVWFIVREFKPSSDDGV